ncbi:MAG: PAS domain S-box protein [Pseudomonadota bacterium]
MGHTREVASRRATDQVIEDVLADAAVRPGEIAAIVATRDAPLLAFTAGRRIVVANTAAETYFGYGRHQLDGQPTEVIIPARFRQPGAPPQPPAPDLTTVELPGLHRDGRELPTSWTFGSVQTAEGGLLFVLVVRDLAEVALEIDSLRRNDSRYRSLLLASASVVWVTNARGELLEPQPPWQDYTGQSWEQACGTGWIQAVHPEDRDRVMRDWAETLRASASVFSTHGRIWSAQHQSWRAFQTRAVAVRDRDGAEEGAIVEWVGALTDVQDVVDAQERLSVRGRDLEHRFRAVYENALDGIMLTDDTLHVVDANPAACRLLGRPREAIVGRSTAELVPPGETVATPERLGEFRAARTMTGEGSILLPDGTVRRAEFGAVANVSPGIHLSIFRDIEDRKRAEEAQQFLDEASAVLGASLEYDETLASMARLAVPQIADWTAVDLVDDDGSLRRVAVAHVDPSKVDLAWQVWKRQRPSISDPTGVGAVVRTGKPDLIELVTDEMLVAGTANNPELLPVIRGLGLRSAMTVPLSARGTVIGAISFVSAESRRRYSQADLAFAQELARRATYAIENALFVRDLRLADRTKDVFLRRAEHLQATASQLVRADSVEAIARAFRSAEPKSPVSALAWSLYLRSGDELQLLSATDVFHDNLKGWTAIPLTAHTPLTEVARTGEAVWFANNRQMYGRFQSLPTDSVRIASGARVVLPLGAGPAPIGVLGVVFETDRAFDADERAYLTAVADLWGQALHRARLAEAEREAIRRALDAETLATRKKDEFLAMVGHELRNPLAPIVTATSLLRVRGRATSRELEILDRQARHLVRLVDDLLDISRITSGKLTLKRGRVDLAEVIAQAVESTAVLFEERKIQLFIDVARPRTIVDGDRERLVQVVSNVLVNAAKFTPHGRSVFVTAATDGARAVVSVRDEGQGIEPELLPRVFELFSQGRQSADRRTGGLGLGLAIARSIVVAHEGQIDIASPGTGGGTTVTLRLPAAPELQPGPQDGAPAAEPAARAGNRHRVLIVDDNEDSAEMLAAFLGEVGYDCYVAADGQRALSISREVLPDAAILDIGLPDIDGHQLAREMRASLAARTPKLIALTGYAQDGDRKLALEAGFVEHLAKPVEMSKLTAKLSGLLGTDTP